MSNDWTDWTDITEPEATRLIDEATDDGVRVTFRVPRVAQGQIVERSYAGLGQLGILRCITDNSDRTVQYAVRDWTDDDEENPGLNGEPA